jgi:tetratricopeptide (TPR) repeat protein
MVGLTEWPDGTVSGRYGFLHAMYHEVIYARVAEIRRIQLHRRIAARKETAYGERVGEIAAELAVHFEKGREITRTVHYLGKAGENAVRRSAHQEAVSHLTKGLDLLTTLPETPERAQQELQLHLTLGTSLMATKGYAAPELERLYARARELCSQAKETPQFRAVLGGLWVFYVTRAQLQTAQELAEQCLAVAGTRQRPTPFLWAHCFMGQTLYGLGRLQESRTHFEQSLRFYDPRKHNPRVATSPQDPGETSLAYLARVLWLLGYPEQALEKSGEACTLAQQLGHPYSLAHALSLSPPCINSEARCQQREHKRKLRLPC